MGCFGECLELGPPPDTILFLPPPPAPSFLQTELLFNTTPCSANQLCELQPNSNKIPENGDFLDLPRKDVESWSVSGIDDTWLLVLVASSIGVLFLGALLAMFLLKCREMNMFGSNDCSLHAQDHRPVKTHEPRDHTSVPNINTHKIMHPAEAVIYHGGPNLQDNRMMWAALTPRGTQHFISENFPRDLLTYAETDNHYETIENIQPVYPSQPNYQTYQKDVTLKIANSKPSFDNSGFIDYDYEEPTPLIESYQLSQMEELEGPEYQTLENSDMRCVTQGIGPNMIRRGIVNLRPRVSQPTRIEHPNLPPLNLYPHKCNTLKKNTINFKHVDTSTLPKYGC